MYSIGNIIYGAPITDEIVQRAMDLADELDAEDLDALGFTTLYHGSADRQVGFCGVLLGEIDETDDLKVSDVFGLRPTEEQIAEVAAAYEAVPEKLRDLLTPPDIWIVWSTS